jgi:hypothetical protein
MNMPAEAVLPTPPFFILQNDYLAYVFFLGATISWLLNNNLATESRWRQLNLFPVLGGIFDLLENTSTSLVMIGYPERRLLIAQMAAIFTLVKWIFVGGSFVILMVIMGIWVVRKLRAGR